MRGRKRPAHVVAFVVGAVCLAALSLACRRKRPDLKRAETPVVVVDPTEQATSRSVGVDAVDVDSLQLDERGHRRLELGAQGKVAVRAKSTASGETYVLSIPSAAAVVPPLADKRLSLVVRSPDGQAVQLAWMDSDGGVETTSRGPAGAVHGFANLPVFSGSRHTLKVQTLKGNQAAAGIYVLSVAVAPIGPGDEREPNDTFAEAPSLLPAHRSPEVAGYLPSAKDEDWYHVPFGDLGPTSLIDLAVQPPADVALVVAAARAGGDTVATTEGSPGEKVALSGLAIRALAANTRPDTVERGAPARLPGLFVQIRAKSGRALERPYVLSVRSDTGQGREAEPNDAQTSATRLEAFDGTVRGALHAGDVDYFVAALATPATVSAALQADRVRGIAFDVLPPGASEWVSASRERDNLVVVLQGAQAGNAYIRVSPRHRRGRPGPYQLTLTTAATSAGGE